MSEPKIGKREAKKLAFARAFGDPTSPVYNVVAHAYRVAYPKCSDKNAARCGYRLLHDPVVKEELANIAKRSRAIAGGDLSVEAYAQQCSAHSEILLKRGGQGDAAAAAKFKELEGRARGHFVIKHEDMTPPERKVIPPSQLLAAAQAYVRTMQELNEPNPLPLISAKVSVQAAADAPAPPPYADYSIVTAEEG